MKRVHIHVTGIVQGVGFRPFVYNLAKSLDLKGWVLNSSEGVHIEVEGSENAINLFLNLLQENKPPRAEIESIEVKEMEPAYYTDFTIKESSRKEREFVLISPDIATCEECKKELFDPKNRRYRYPFINCTNCGPRFTIIEDIPYDRPNTTMKKFRMCSECQKEYDDPTNRRFHAQPNACHVCGPQILFLANESVFSMIGMDGRKLSELEEERLKDYEIQATENMLFLEGESALKAAEKLIRKGRILALKGLGGFHLACLARDSEAVKLLRKRKRRPSKAFAVMFKNLDEVAKAVDLNEEARKLLESPQAPIVLLKKKYPEYLAEEVAPGLADYGVMLPSTPLHHLLLNDLNEPLVMTSGNLSEEPIAKDNQEAIERLDGIADGFLIHNRPIYSRYDDSVLNLSRKPIMIRRARSYAPYPLEFSFKDLPPVFGAGPELKCTFTLTKEKYAFVSQHLGDLEDEATFKVYVETFELYKKLFRIEPEIFSCDLHPDYLSTRFCEDISQGKEIYKVQHHIAHIASVVGEYSLKEPAIGFAFDGTGYGSDGTVWGGEVIFFTGTDYERVGSLSLFPLPTGEASIKKPYRVAAAMLMKVDDEFAAEIAKEEYALLQRLIENSLNTLPTSSMGRLFDAVAVITGVGRMATYEGELAMKLEALAGKASPKECLAKGFYTVEITRKGRDGLLEIQWLPIISEIVEDVKNGVPNAVVACRFHNTVALAIKKTAEVFSKELDTDKLVFSGGVFQNSLLNSLIEEVFSSSDYKLYFHKLLPPNDGCISFGQVTFTAQNLLK